MDEISSHRWSIEESLFYIYLTTVSAARANEILALKGSSEPKQTMAEFAKKMAKTITDGYLLRTPVFPDLPRYVIRNGKFQLQVGLDPDGTRPPTSDLQPDEIRFLVENRSVRMPVQPPGRPTSLNSFMIFRGK